MFPVWQQIAGKVVQPVPRRRKAVALGLAVVADLCQIVFFPAFFPGGFSPFDAVLDVATALGLLLVLGFRWRLLAGLVVEAIPGLALFPTWSALVITLPVKEAEEEGERPMRKIN